MFCFNKVLIIVHIKYTIDAFNLNSFAIQKWTTNFNQTLEYDFMTPLQDVKKINLVGT